ncbi:MAG: hypothetical protein JWM19_448 [Actinomycetia bacterium]|nr:hypothetical protein [Actinomycetes bacterium]
MLTQLELGAIRHSGLRYAIIALTAQQAEELGSKLEAGKKTAPTRQHPHAPASPGVLKTAGPVAAAADKARDAITTGARTDRPACGPGPG